MDKLICLAIFLVMQETLVQKSFLNPESMIMCSVLPIEGEDFEISICTNLYAAPTKGRLHKCQHSRL